MPIRILSAADVRAALPMPKAIDAMRHAYSQLSAGKATAPPRQHISTDKGVTLIMPAYLPEGNEFGIKVVSVYDDNPNLDLPRITATVLVLDPATGTPKAFMDGSQPDCHPNRRRWRRGSRFTRSAGRNNGRVIWSGCTGESTVASGDGSQKHHLRQPHQSYTRLSTTTRYRNFSVDSYRCPRSQSRIHAATGSRGC